MSRAMFAGRFFGLATALLLMTFVGKAVANETMTDRCSGDVSFPSAYDGPPVGPGTMVLTRGNAQSGNWSFAMHQTIDSAGHIRWWCHSTTGNWADPGTWTVDDAGATYVCGPDGEECTLSVDASGHPVDTSGWTAERSRCDSHSSVFRARLGANRLLQIECLDENTRTGAQRLVGEPDISAGGFGNGKPAKPLSVTFVPVQRAPVNAWFGDFVYPRGQHLSDGRLALTISPNSGRNRLDIPMTRSSYRVSVTEKQINPITLNQIMASVSARSEVRYVGNSFKADLTVGTVKTVMTPHDAAALTASTHSSAGLPHSASGTTSGASRPTVGITSKPTFQAGADTGRVLKAPASSLTERADSMTVSPDVTLMLYLAKGDDGRFSTYAIRYLHRKGDRLLSDVMLLPAVEAPH